MKLLITLFITLCVLFAKSDTMSPIPPAKNIFIDLDPIVCDEMCAQELLDQGFVFSFLAKLDETQTQTMALQSQIEYYARLFRIFDEAQISVRIAMLVPQKNIRRYAISTTNAVTAYLLSKQNDFELEVFNSTDETAESIINALEEIQSKGHKYIIAPLTVDGAKILAQNISEDMKVYIPTVHSLHVPKSQNILFGGIDYKEQVDTLMRLSNNRLAYFSDGSSISKTLNSYVEQADSPLVFHQEIKDSKVNFKRILRGNRALKNSSIFMNTPLVKTSLIASQLRVYNIKPNILLSTQINYNPMLLTLTQYLDRKNLYLANSIGKTTISLQETNELFGHNIVFDWVNYSTSLGIDYFFTRYFVPTEARAFAENIKDNQIIYDISIVKPKPYSFSKVEY